MRKLLDCAVSVVTVTEFAGSKLTVKLKCISHGAAVGGLAVYEDLALAVAVNVVKANA